ncbi:MAG: trehalose-phosphatase, partial [Acidimicrobiales bacterium]
MPDPWACFADSPRSAGLFLDFDGSLSEITHHPDGARPRPGVSRLLGELVSRLGRVAILTGRPVGYLVGMIPAAVDIVGLYGLEWRRGGRHETLPEAEVWRATVRGVVAEAVDRFGSRTVEAKGLSLTLHYRDDSDRLDRLERWANERALDTGLVLRPARKSLELHPPIERDKGTALLELASGLDPVAYVGDDLGDLPAFDGLDVLDARGVRTVRVAVRSGEAPPDLLGRADVGVDGPAGAEQLLTGLVELV